MFACSFLAGMRILGVNGDYTGSSLVLSPPITFLYGLSFQGGKLYVPSGTNIATVFEFDIDTGDTGFSFTTTGITAPRNICSFNGNLLVSDGAAGDILEFQTNGTPGALSFTSAGGGNKRWIYFYNEFIYVSRVIGGISEYDQSGVYTGNSWDPSIVWSDIVYDGKVLWGLDRDNFTMNSLNSSFEPSGNSFSVVNGEDTQMDYDPSTDSIWIGNDNPKEIYQYK